MGHFSIRTRFGQYLHRFRQKKKWKPLREWERERDTVKLLFVQKLKRHLRKLSLLLNIFASLSLIVMDIECVQNDQPTIISG